MPDYTFKESRRRYNRLFAPSITIYSVVCIFGASALDRMENPAIWLIWAISLATITPILIVLWVIWRFIKETDEFTRALHLEALGLAGLMCAGLAGTLGFLQLYEAMPVWPLATLMLLPLYMAVYGAIVWVRGGRDCA